jgi:type IV fimbrial biogenesis protein FimT
VQLRLDAVRPHARGFTLIELMIAVVIFAFLILLAGPMYTDFIANSRIRNAGEALLNGVRVTQAEAVRRNTVARFVLDTTTGYKVYATDPADGTDDDGRDATHLWAVIPYVFADHGASKATFTPNGAATTVTFDGLGRIMPNADTSISLTKIDITNPDVATPRNLRVAINAIGGTGGTKLCDPAMPAADPAGCP